VRHLDSVTTQWSYRVLSGKELMSLIGWDPSFYQDELQETHDAVLSNLAGNAFSGFAAAPLLIATFALYSRFVPSTGCSQADPISVSDSIESRAESGQSSFEDSL
jgi:hypothetical protein